jgi:UDP:flavonoid glycosyltransferase YjiC (YdhE family)
VSRILLTWELGLNLGHLARLLPVASRLRERGHAVLVAARDLAAAARVLQPGGISFVQAPHLTRGHPLPHRAAGYSDILRAQGWGDRTTLAGLTEGWINLYRMFRPDIVVADYSPTATLAAHLTHVPCLLVGNGFELPPATAPLPPFPGFSWATPERAADSEALVVENANAVARACGGTGVTSLCELINARRALFATFPELDHYGQRDGAQYIGPLLGQFATTPSEWPAGRGLRIFAYVRPDTRNVQSLLAALVAREARVVCVAAGFSSAQLRPFRRDSIRFSAFPVDLQPLLNADLCITYGAEGTMMNFIMSGVPQLISPWHVEAYMAARRIEAAGLGLTADNVTVARSVEASIGRLIADPSVKQAVKAFARHAATTQNLRSADAVVDALHALLQIGVAH